MGFAESVLALFGCFQCMHNVQNHALGRVLSSIYTCMRSCLSACDVNYEAEIHARSAHHVLFFLCNGCLLTGRKTPTYLVIITGEATLQKRTSPA